MERNQKAKIKRIQKTLHTKIFQLNALPVAILHKIVALPVIYDLCQWAAGAGKNRAVLREEFGLLPLQGCALDLGGGTGLSRLLLPKTWNYCCLDPDQQKIDGFRAKFPHGECVKASACYIPFPDQSVDLCLMVAVTHHLTDNNLGLALKETKRVLRPAGQLLIMDAVWNPTNLRGRLFWSVDRGSFPRNASALEEHLKRHFCIERKRTWTVHHDYALYWCHKN